MIKVSIDRKVMKSVTSGVADQIKNKIDLNQVKKLCKKQYGIETINGIEHKDANIVVIKNQVACRLDLEVRFPMSILISTKENSNSTLPENNDTTAEFNEMTAELDDIPDELDILEEDSNIPQVIDIAKQLDEIPKEDSNMLQEPDIKKQLDDLFGGELDDKEIS